jgi:hypothetical protein
MRRPQANPSEGFVKEIGTFLIFIVSEIIGSGLNSCLR